MAHSDTILDGLRWAIQGEADGYQFYKIAAETTKDPTGKEQFLALADEEKGHMEFLKAQYKSISENGKVDFTVHLRNDHHFTAHGPIFSEELVSRINESQFEMSALSIGIKLELVSIQFYREQAELTDDADVQKFYLDLVEWEQEHYHSLLRQQEMLQDAFWSKGGFAPF
jgi:rubrerythrin